MYSVLSAVNSVFYFNLSIIMVINVVRNWGYNIAYSSYAYLCTLPLILLPNPTLPIIPYYYFQIGDENKKLSLK